MDLATLLATIGVPAASVAFSGFTWREMRKDRKGTDKDRLKADEEARVQRIAATAQQAVNARIAPLEDRVRDIELTRTDDAVRAVVRAEIAPLTAVITSLETKVDVFWKAVNVNVAKVLHQPDPRRRHVDALLERFMAEMEGGGMLTFEEHAELHGYLETIRDWEPGKHAAFPIRDGEQFGAAILLAALDYMIVEEGARHA